ncbi:MAG: cobalt-precorrin-5B (C(1))-methyltransferase CbiD [Synergistaceae bacterium]|nr:cobalt-precorrin-5B (C(1))-methyltransferase CbiD [Synergistaceae bacterium]
MPQRSLTPCSMELNKGLREGYSTGSCAAAAAKAAAICAMGGTCPHKIDITTPEEKIFTLPIIGFEGKICGVIKDAGDDPDSTDGLLIKALVEISDSWGKIIFNAGEGVGTVTLPGLKVPVGEPAINPVPRQMIERAVREVIGERGAVITISVPEGAERAKRTFNPRLGIVGGISILGTTGRVKPMNEASLLESLTLELNTHSAMGRKSIAVAFAGTGETALRSAYGIKNRAVVQCGNYIGYLLEESARLGLDKLLVGGHPGKLLKVTAGTFNTHNRIGGGAKEALCTHAAIEKVSSEIIRELYEAPTVEEAIHIMDQNKLDYLWDKLARITAKRCQERVFGDIVAAVAFIDNTGKILGATDNASFIAEEIRDGI